MDWARPEKPGAAPWPFNGVVRGTLSLSMAQRKGCRWVGKQEALGGPTPPSQVPLCLLRPVMGCQGLGSCLLRCRVGFRRVVEAGSPCSLYL